MIWDLRLQKEQGLQTELRGFFLAHEEHGGRAVVPPGGGARGHGAGQLLGVVHFPILVDLDVEDGLQLRHLLLVGGPVGELVGVEDDGVFLLALGDDHGDDLVLEPAGVDGRDGPALALQGEGVLLLPGDAQLQRHALGGGAHVVGAVHLLGLALELALGQRVHEGGIAGADAPAGVADIEYGVRHRLGAACQNDVILAGHDTHNAILHGGHAGRALTHDSVSGDRFGDTCLERGHTGDVGLIGGLSALAHDDFVHFSRVDAGALDRAFDDSNSHIVC